MKRQPSVRVSPSLMKDGGKVVSNKASSSITGTEEKSERRNREGKTFKNGSGIGGYVLNERREMTYRKKGMRKRQEKRNKMR